MMERKIKGVRANAKEAREQRVQKGYDPSIFKVHKKRVIYTRTMENNFVYLSKDVLRTITSTELAVYPVLCTEANFRENNWFQISQENIGEKANVSHPTAAKGISGLLDRGILERRFVTGSRLHIYEYRVEFNRGNLIGINKDDLFQFYHSIVRSGIWSHLSSVEKQLYIEMRMAASFEPELYADQEGIDLDGMNGHEFYQNEYASRKWDVLSTGESSDEFGYYMREFLCELVNIGPKQLEKALRNLKRNYLISDVEDHCYVVCLKPDFPEVNE